MHKLKFPKSLLLLVLPLSLIVLSVSASPSSGVAPELGNAASFAVLGAETVTNTGDSVINGDLGVWAGTAITGFPPGVFTGTIHPADGVAGAAQTSVTDAYDDLVGQAFDTDLTGQNLGGLTHIPGVYFFSTSAQLTGDLVLDANGDPNAVWAFRIGSTLTTTPSASVAFINAGPNTGCNVFWQVGSSATIGTYTQFIGNILALESISLNTGASLAGRALAREQAQLPWIPTK